MKKSHAQLFRQYRKWADKYSKSNDERHNKKAMEYAGKIVALAQDNK